MKTDDPGKLLRLFREINLLSASKKGYTVNEIAEKLGVSYRTVYRDFKIFGHTGFELIQDPINKKYRLAKAEEISENLSFSAQEADILHQSLMAMGDDASQKNLLIEKIQALSASALKVNMVTKTAVARNIQLITEAIRDRKQVLLQDYHSAQSQTISDRFVEPFAFSDNGASVQCFEIPTKKNKFFKIERIGTTKALHRNWEFAPLHQEQEEDIFNISLTQPMGVHLRLGMLSASLLQEEYPSSASYITELDPQNFELKTKVQGLKAIGRFVLGLIDDISVVSPPELKEYLKNTIEKASKKL